MIKCQTQALMLTNLWKLYSAMNLKLFTDLVLTKYSTTINYSLIIYIGETFFDLTVKIWFRVISRPGEASGCSTKIVVFISLIH